MSDPERGGRPMTDEEYLAWQAASDPLGPVAPAPAAPPVDPLAAAMEREAAMAEREGDTAGAAALRGYPAPPAPGSPEAVRDFVNDPEVRARVAAREAADAADAADWMAPPRAHEAPAAPPDPFALPMPTAADAAALSEWGASAPAMSDAEAALWRASEAMPPLGSGGSVSLPGAAVVPFADARTPAAPAPASGARGAAPDLAEALSPRPRRRAAAPAAAPVADPNQELIDGLMSGASTAGRAYDNRTEDPLSRDLRLNDDMRRLAQRQSELRAIAAAEEMDRVSAEEIARNQLEDQRREATRRGADSYRRLNDRAASLTIDPDGFYHSRGTGGTIASAIAIGLGGLGSAIGGGPNIAAQMISDEIERDIQAQQQRIESAFRRADAEGTLYDMARQEFSDRGAALDASRALALENAAARVAEQEAMLGSEEARINAAALAAQLRDTAAASRIEAERAEQRRQLENLLLEARVRQRMADATRAERRAMGGGGPARPSPVTTAQMDAFNRARDSGATVEAAAATAGIDPRLAPSAGRFAEASSGDSAAVVASLATAADRVGRVVEANREDIPAVGIFDASADLSDAGRTMRQDTLALANAYGRMHSGGAIGTEEQENFRAILFGSGTEAELRHGLEIVADEVEARTRRNRDATTAGDATASAVASTGGRLVEED